MSTPLAVTDETFETEVEKAGGLVVVDFWAAWCGPCRMIAPVLDALASEYAGRVKVTKLDVDTNIKTSTRFNIRSIPMVLFFKDGKVVDQVLGAVPRPVFEAKFRQHAPQHGAGAGANGTAAAAPSGNAPAKPAS